MRKFTEKVHHAPQSEAIWLKQSDVAAHSDSNAVEAPDTVRPDVSAAKLPFVFSQEYGVRFCGLEKLHPFDTAKGRRILKFLQRGNVLEAGQFHEPSEITKAELLRVHTAKYLRSLKWSLNAAKISEIPPLLLVPNCFVQRGYLRPMRFQAAGSILAAQLALHSGWAINLGGGFHHCCAHRGGGFCPYADITLLVARLFEEAADCVRTVMIVDLDAHQGNGHERDFLHSPNVFIMDMYNAAIYPRDHAAKLAIRCAVELKPHTADAVYLAQLKRWLTSSLNEFRPDFVVYNAGTDVLKGDPLGQLAITAEGIIERDEFVFSTCRRQRIPIVMLLSGGYLKSSARVIADSIANLKQKGLLACS